MYVEFFVERMATPTKIVQELNTDDGTLGKMVSSEGKKGIVREIECGIALDLDGARALNEWLSNKITELETILASGKAGPVKRKGSKE